MWTIPSKYALDLDKRSQAGVSIGLGEDMCSLKQVTRGNRRSRRAWWTNSKSFIRKMPVVVKWGVKGTTTYI